MNKSIKLILYSLVLVFLIEFKGFSKDAPPKPDPRPQAPETINPAVEEIRMGLKSDFQLIFFSGLGGAVLGLSTLSFVDKPSRELRRISYGFAIGAIASSIYVLYKTTSKSMKGGGLSQGMGKRRSSPMVVPENQTTPPFDDQNYDDYKEEDYYDDYYDDEFYGNHRAVFMIASGKDMRINFPLIEFFSEKEKGFTIYTNLFKLRF